MRKEANREEVQSAELRGDLREGKDLTYYANLQQELPSIRTSPEICVIIHSTFSLLPAAGSVPSHQFGGPQEA